MKRDNEYQNIDGSVKIDEYTDGQAYSVFESSEEFFKQWAKDNAQDNGQGVQAVRIKGVKTCKNGNICIYGPDVVTDTMTVHFVSPGRFGIISGIQPKIVYDKDGVPEGVEFEQDDAVLSAKLYDKRLVILQGKPMGIK